MAGLCRQFSALALLEIIAAASLAACASDTKRAKAKLADWHVEWAYTYSEEKQKGLLRRLLEMKDPWAAGELRAWYARYVGTHQLFLLVRSVTEKVEKKVINALEPHIADHFYTCSQGPEAFIPTSEVVSLIDRFGLADEVNRQCAIARVASRQLIRIRSDAELHKPQTEIAEARAVRRSHVWFLRLGKLR